MGHTLVVFAVLVVIMAISRGQLQYFYPFGTSHPDRQQQQQQYQSVDTQTQSLPVQLTRPASFNYLQTSPQEAAPYVPASNVNEKYVLQIKVKPTGERKLDYEKRFVPSNAPLVLPQVQPSSAYAVSQLPSETASPPLLSHQQLTSAEQTRDAAAVNVRTAPVAVPFSLAPDVSQFRFSGRFANYSY